jgi:predicted acetyltransferase
MTNASGDAPEQVENIMMITIKKADLIEIDALRNDYLKSLPEFQELFLEIMMDHSQFYTLVKNDETIGYAIKNSEDVLIEFYLKDRYIPGSSEYFKKVIDELSVKKVFCKSFDYLLLNCCLVQNYSYSLVGCMFRDFYETEIIKDDGLSIRHANETDVPLLLQQTDDLAELYGTAEQLDHFIKNKNVFLFSKQNKLLGCGTIIRTHKNRNFYDIGVWVSSDYRKLGYATQIICYLRDYCISNNWKPTCGCAIENVASRKTLEKSGFISKHSLIQFEVTK